MFLWNERVTCCITHSTPKNSPYGDFCHFCTRKSFVAKITKNCHFGNKKRVIFGQLGRGITVRLVTCNSNISKKHPFAQQYQKSARTEKNQKSCSQKCFTKPSVNGPLISAILYFNSLLKVQFFIDLEWSTLSEMWNE